MRLQSSGPARPGHDGRARGGGGDLEPRATQRLASRSPRYGGAGRPEYHYAWISQPVGCCECQLHQMRLAGIAWAAQEPGDLQPAEGP